jgi:predicted regulator of Ras-like GTPase activity (Roadblock/LC7/MglB family)
VFDEILRQVLEHVDGASCVLLAGRDGMVVAAVVRDGGPSPDALAAAMAELLRKADSASRDAALGPTGELTVGGVDGQVVLREVTSGYLLATSLSPQGSVGRARFELRKAATVLEPELV